MLVPTKAGPASLPTVAVFAKGDTELALVYMGDSTGEGSAAPALAGGYLFAGSIGVVECVPLVSIEAGHTAAMAYAGIIYAGMVGSFLQHTAASSADKG